MPSDELVGMAEKAARGGLFLFVGNALSTVILAIGAIIIARFLGPSNYGLYTLALVMPSVFTTLADAGMNSALIRFPARLRSEGDYRASNRAIRLGFLLKLSLSVAAFLICYFGADWITITLLNRPSLTPYLQLAGLLIIFQAIFDAANNSFIGLDLMQYSASTQILYSVLKSVLAPALILLGFGIGGAIIGYVLGMFVAGAVGATILFTKYAHSTAAATSQQTVKLSALIDYSLPLYVATILSVFLGQYQNLVLARLATNVQIGNFNAAWNFNSLLSILIYPISTAIFPMFSKMNPESQRRDLARGFVLAVKYASLLLIPASIGVMVFSQDLVLLTYGRGYVLAPQYLTIFSAIYLLTGLGLSVIPNFLNGVAATRTVLKINAVTLAVYLPLGPALAWVWGPYGLLIAYILSSTTSTLYGIRKTSAGFGAYPDLAASVRILLASLIAAAPSAALVHFYVAGIGLVNLIAGGVLYLFAYLTMAPILGAVIPQDINNLETILCRTRAVASIVKPILAYETRILFALHRN
jgi:O-antigen/teichoic acid export membrane protein